MIIPWWTLLLLPEVTLSLTEFVVFYILLLESQITMYRESFQCRLCFGYICFQGHRIQNKCI